MNRNPSRDVQIFLPLSKLIPSKRNPRRVKPQREAHRQMVASLRAHGLLAPLVVRACDPALFKVIAGNRRLAGLRDLYKDMNKPPKVPCILRVVDDDTADALALAENFIREPMHPLDEAEAFARLAREEAKGVESIAAEFGVSQPYVRQRMKLATLAEPVKAAYRQGGIDTATAETFASVPADRQAQVWEELGGNPQHAAHVRNVIGHAWIDAASARFDLSVLPEGAVSSDLFGNRVLVERKAFMQQQAEALLKERQALIEDGWADVVVGPQADVQDRLWSMDEASKAYDEATTASVMKLAGRRDKLEAKYAELDEKSDPDGARADALGSKLEALDEAEAALLKDAPAHYAEATKAIGTVFLLLYPDGRVRSEHRVPRARPAASNGRSVGATIGYNGSETISPPTSNDLKEPQLATTFTHQDLALREATLKDAKVRRRILAMILHDKVRSEALAIRRDANGTTLHADHAEDFASTAWDMLRQRRAELDPLLNQQYVADHLAYEAMAALPDKKLDALIDLLTVDCITAHLQRKTQLVERLAKELGIDVRRYWRPDERWLGAYQKVQLAHLLGELCGPVHARVAETKKKSELVSQLAQLFTDAADGSLQDAELADKLNAWLPFNLREESQAQGAEQAKGDEATASAA